MSLKKALILGVSGQDGAYLAEILLDKGYKVYGTSRDAELSTFSSLKALNIYNRIELISMSLIDFRSVMQVILDVKPDEIYNLAGQTSVGLSFVQPVETLESISIGTLNILEVIRFHKLNVKFYNASSSECFGETLLEGADEETAFRPRSPYAVAKSAAFWQVVNYRNAYNLFACSGLLFNHESPLRPARFVTKKIIKTACEIQKGKVKKLQLGNVQIYRDWGYAKEYAEAMYLMLQHNSPEDFVISTGESISLKQFVKLTFDYLGLNMDEYVEFDDSLIRPSEIMFNKGNSAKAKSLLNWQADTKVNRLIELMIENELKTN
jgi:GDPmannose 4,6-dehydratase